MHNLGGDRSPRRHIRGVANTVRRRVIGGVAVVLASGLLAGCTTVVFGSAQRAAGGPPPGVVDVSLLDTGNYPTKPGAPLGPAGTEFKGRLLDAARMAEFVTGPWQVDPAFVDKVGATLILKNAGALSLDLSPAVADAMKDNQAFIYGFTGMRSTTDRKRDLSTAVYRFRDPQSAADAAKLMADVGLKELQNPDPPNQDVAGPLTLPAHPETVGVVHQFASYPDKQPLASVAAYTPRGPYVLLQYAEVHDASPDPARDLVSRTIDVQGPEIDKFTPTDPAGFAGLPSDPSGLVARMLPQKDDDLTVNDLKPFSRHASLFFQDNPVTSDALFGETGMDLYIKSSPSVYQARDAAAAATMAESFVRDVSSAPKNPLQPADPVNFMPASRCLQTQPDPANPAVQRSFYCVAPAGRWVIETSSGQLRDAQQQTAAQYVMLLAK